MTDEDILEIVDKLDLFIDCKIKASRPGLTGDYSVYLQVKGELINLLRKKLIK